MKNHLRDLSQYQNHLGFKNKIGRVLWGLGYWILFRPFPGVIFKKWRNFVLKCFGAKITGDVTVYASVKIWAPWNLELDTACVSASVTLYNVNKVILKKYAVISQNAHISTASHNITSLNHELVTSPVVLMEQSWVASDAFVGMGVTVGQGAVVGARAAVFKDVASWTVVGGNPAKFIKKREFKND